MNSQQGPNSLPNHSPNVSVSLDESPDVALGSIISPSSSMARSTLQNPSTDVAPGLAVQEQVRLGGNSSITRTPAKRSFTDATGGGFFEGESSTAAAEDARAKRLATESRVSANNIVNSSPPLPEREILGENATTEPIQRHHRVITENEVGLTPQPDSSVNGQATLLFRESSHSRPNLGPLRNLPRSLISPPPFPETLNDFVAPSHGQRIFQRGTFSGNQIRPANIPTSSRNHLQENHRPYINRDRPYINRDGVGFIPNNPSLNFSQHFNPPQPLRFMSGFDDNNQIAHNPGAFMYQHLVSQEAGPSSSAGLSRHRNYSVGASSSGFQGHIHYEAFLQRAFENPSEPFVEFVDNNGTMVFHYPRAVSNQSLSEEAVYSQEIVHSVTENYNNQVATPANQPGAVAPPVEFVLEHVSRNWLMEDLRILRHLLLMGAFERRGLQQQYLARHPQAGLHPETIMHHIQRDVFIPDDEDKHQCVICCEDFEEGDDISKLDLCVHKFHFQCIKQWLVERNACPTCRQTALTMNNA